MLAFDASEEAGEPASVRRLTAILIDESGTEWRFFAVTVSLMFSAVVIVSPGPSGALVLVAWPQLGNRRNGIRDDDGKNSRR